MATATSRRLSELKNGATVIASQQVEPDGRVVLAKTQGESACPYVTWAVDDEGNAYWGHYYIDLMDAFADFTSRANANNLRRSGFAV